MSPQAFIQGEFQRRLDERYRVAIPQELLQTLSPDGADCILAKERPGCLSLWNAQVWRPKLEDGVALVQSKMQAGKLEGRISQVQLLGRLLSTRHKTIQLGARGRLLIPEGFREFLQVEPGGDVLVVGAAVCVEIWSPQVWVRYLESRMPRFRRLLDKLSG